MVRLFLQHHWGVVILSLYWVCAILWFVPGSLEGDEAIYAQVLRETLARDSFFTLYWRDAVWMEKPPLFFWMGIALTKMGISYEYAGRYISGIFGYATVLLTYYSLYTLDRDRIAGLFAAVCLMSTSLFIEASRYGILDTLLTFFVLLAYMSLWQFSNSEESPWLYLSMFFTGCSLMTKSVVGLIPLVVLLGLILYKPKYILGKGRLLAKSIIVFLSIAAPWHLYMYVSQGSTFTSQYLGYHILERFGSNFINSPYSSYTDVVLLQLGVWAILIPTTLLFYGFIFKNISQNTRNTVNYFLIVSIAIYIILSFAQTKVPFYLLPILPLLAIVLGAITHALRIKNLHLYFYFLASLSLLHFLPIISLQFSDVARVNILIPQIVMSIFTSPMIVFYILGFGLLFIAMVLLLFTCKRIPHSRKNCIVITIFLSMSMMVPFSLDRSRDTREVGTFISSYSQDHGVEIVFVLGAAQMRTNTLLLYVPLGIDVESIDKSTAEKIRSHEPKILCVEPLENNFSNDILYISQKHIVTLCK